MKKRNRLIAIVALGVSAAAIWAGVAVTSSAMAAESPTDTVDLTLVAPAPDGNGAISCEFKGVPLTPPPPEEVTADSSLGSLPVSAVAIPVEGDGGAVSGSGTISGLAITAPVDENLIPVGTVAEFAVVVVSTGDLLATDEIRPGTAQECAALQPQSGVFGQSIPTP